jgi:WhiB family redox-sensing transcriptional regulator
MWAWQADALCRGLPSDVFYPPDNERGGSKRRREDHAKRICRACPVLDACRRHAIELGEPYGVWGATTPAERQALRAGARPGSRQAGCSQTRLDRTVSSR